MKRFQFSLQKLLNLREFREKQAEIELGKANAARDAVQLDLESVEQKRVTAAFERGGSASVQDLLAIERYIARLDAKKEKLIEDLAACELVVERARGVYLEATKDRQIISKLREKKEATWRRKYLSDEAAVLDDIVNARGNAASASGQ